MRANMSMHQILRCGLAQRTLYLKFLYKAKWPPPKIVPLYLPTNTDVSVQIIPLFWDLPIWLSTFMKLMPVQSFINDNCLCSD